MNLYKIDQNNQKLLELLDRSVREQEKLNLDNHGEQVRVMKKGLEVRYFSVFEYASLELLTWGSHLTVHYRYSGLERHIPSFSK